MQKSYSNGATYGSLANNSFSEFIEVDEELLESDAVLGDGGHDALLNILLHLEGVGRTLVVAWVTCPTGVHCLDDVAEWCSGFHFI